MWPGLILATKCSNISKKKKKQRKYFKSNRKQKINRLRTKKKNENLLESNIKHMVRQADRQTDRQSEK